MNLNWLNWLIWFTESSTELLIAKEKKRSLDDSMSQTLIHMY